MNTEAMKRIAEAIDLALTSHHEPDKLSQAREIVSSLCAEFPLYTNLD